MHAQRFDTSVIRRNSVRNTPFVLLEIADSFARKGDSVNATAYFIKVKPECLIYNGVKPETLDERFNETRVMAWARERYRELFLRAYNKPDTKTGDTLYQMYQEDQDTRTKAGNCKDSFSCAIYLERMRYADSIHFRWLYNYVRKNGWPTIENGLSYAGIIAMHDGYRHCDYLPYLRKAVFDGEAPYTVYNGVLNRCLKPSFAQMMKEYGNKAEFDVSCILKGKKVDTLQLEKIRSFINVHTSIKYLYFVFESKSRMDFNAFLRSGDTWENSNVYWISWDFMMLVDKYYNDAAGIHHKDGIELLPYQYQWAESSLSGKRLKLYLLY